MIIYKKLAKKYYNIKGTRKTLLCSLARRELIINYQKNMWNTKEWWYLDKNDLDKKYEKSIIEKEVKYDNNVHNMEPTGTHNHPNNQHLFLH
jgi:hypothetical protein